jgi:hypothetical protein
MTCRGKFVIWALALAAILLPCGAFAQGKAKGKGGVGQYIFIDVPGTNDGTVSTQVTSGWPLTIRLYGNKELGIGVDGFIELSPFPHRGRKGFLVFTDPDGCHSWVESPPGPVCPPPDELLLEFTPDVDSPGIKDFANGGTLGAGQILNLFDFNTGENNLATPAGPRVGIPDEHFPEQSNADDGYGWGHNDDLPGLVVLYDTGAGLVWNPDFTLASPLQARNVAGLFHSISYFLNDALPTSANPYGRTVIEAQMNVPDHLFQPIFLFDNCVGVITEGVCDASNNQVQIDGVVHTYGAPFSNTLVSLLDRVISIRIFVVNGQAPDVLADEDGNGIVDAADAKMAGYTLLSGQKIVQVKIYYQASDLITAFGLKDLDGNGEVGGVPAPGGIGGLSGVPR